MRHSLVDNILAARRLGLSLRVDNMDCANVSKYVWETEQTDEGLVVVTISVANRVSRVAVSTTSTIAVGSDRDKLSVCLSQNRGTRLSFSIVSIGSLWFDLRYGFLPPKVEIWYSII
jgi:hypothetical protein